MKWIVRHSGDVARDVYVRHVVITGTFLKHANESLTMALAKWLPIPYAPAVTHGWQPWGTWKKCQQWFVNSFRQDWLNAKLCAPSFKIIVWTKLRWTWRLACPYKLRQHSFPWTNIIAITVSRNVAFKYSSNCYNMQKAVSSVISLVSPSQAVTPNENSVYHALCKMTRTVQIVANSNKAWTKYLLCDWFSPVVDRYQIKSMIPRKGRSIVESSCQYGNDTAMYVNYVQVCSESQYIMPR